MPDFTDLTEKDLQIIDQNIGLNLSEISMIILDIKKQKI